MRPDSPKSTAAATAPHRPSGAAITATLAGLMAFASLSTDIYLPALPDMKGEFGRGVELTLSTFLIGFSLGQILWGPIGDRLGRRGPVLAGLALFMVGSAGCALADTLPQLLGWRVVQALGACAGPVLARAMVRDLHSRDKAAQMLSILMLIMGVAPLLGPLIGGQLLRFGSWHLSFWLLVAVSAAMFLAVLRLPETLPTERRNHTPLARSFGVYWTLLKDPVVLGYGIAGGFYYAGIYTYVGGSPFAYIEYYNVDARAYGLLFSLGIFGQMALGFANSRLVMRLGSERMARMGALLIGAASLATLATTYTDLGGLPGLVIALLLFMSGNGIFIANIVAGAMDAHPERAGATSALVGAMQFGSGVFATALLGWMADGTPRPMGTLIATVGLGTLVATFAVTAWKRRREATMA
ncbi:multidrug effflux MFS transporter [Novosphingobium decolorationis]|uniref:Bcr/CflA family efflux transporter n=1 Tax=Novosphingobium decolorationis TaxID=2698673 RepID=A0ABX8E7E0_9SPHN|nr:multidrug effflux MFS transporter [Novosphingobium decolorationis]QVM85092.1 multidrug effflux MFS transporter [Novosphingobium decolorationis]